MKERAKQALLDLKEKDRALEKEFNEYVALIQKELETPEQIAVTLVTSELVNRYERQLIRHSIFSKMTLEEHPIKENYGKDTD